MGLIANFIKARAEPPVPYTLALPSGGLSAGGRPDDYIKAYGEIGWLFACVSRIAFSVGEADWTLHRRVKDGLEKLESHPLLNLLSDANPFMTGQEMMEYTQMWLDLTGDAFWVLNRTARGLPAEVWPVPPNRMRVVPSRSEFIAGYVYKWAQDEVPFKTEEVIHFKYPNPVNLYRGMGPVQALAVDLDSENYAAKYNRNFFQNSAQPDAVLQSKEALTTPQFEQLMERWKAGHQGVDRAHRIAVLTGGMEYKQVSLSQRDMQFRDLRKLNRDLILAAYGVPLSILGISESVNRANAESGEYTFARWTILPRLKRIGHKLDETLVPMFGPDLVMAPADPTPENREQSRADADSGVKAGYMTLDEARTLMGLDPLPGGKGAVLIQPLTSVQVPANGAKSFPVRGFGASVAPLELSGAIGKAFTEGQKDRLGELFIKRLDPRERKLKSFMLGYFAEQKARILSALVNRAIAGRTKAPPTDLFDWAEDEERLRTGAMPLIRAVLVDAAGDAILDYGLGIDFDLANPRVTRWIGERLKLFSTAVTETTKEAITAQLREAEAAGESIPQMQDRIRQYYDGNAGYRAERVARTEVVGASNKGALESYHQAGLKQKEWLSTADERTRPPHADANGQVRDLDEPFMVGGERVMQPGEGSPENAVNCILPGNLIIARGLLAAIRSPYKGPALELSTESGNKLSVTPNHAILTPIGFVRAKDLCPGDYVLGRVDGQGVAPTNQNITNIPVAIEQVFSSLAMIGRAAGRKLAAITDFDGDGGFVDGDIDIIWANGQLKRDVDAKFPKHISDEEFAFDGIAHGLLSDDSPLKQCGFRVSHSTDGRMGGISQEQSLISRQPLHPQYVGGASTPRSNAEFQKPSSQDIATKVNLFDDCHLRFTCEVSGYKCLRHGDSLAIDSDVLAVKQAIKTGIADFEFIQQLSKWFSLPIATDKIVAIRDFNFAGHVYDLQTLPQLYSANGVVVHNCRCAVIPVVG